MSYYEKRIAELEARVAQLAREQRMKAIPVEAKLLERYAVMQADNSRLEAEVERLRKAGDRLVFALEAMDIVMDMDSDHPEVAEWNAAKEGQQS